MTERTIDAERAGGTGNVAVNGPRGADPMSAAEAEEHVERLLGWRTVLGRSDQASLALLREVRRLRNGIGDIQAQFPSVAAGLLEGLKAAEEIARFRAALPEIIGCPRRDFAACQSTDGSCCWRRLHAQKARLLPQPERQDEPGDGA
jgi:hypothetical protein